MCECALVAFVRGTGWLVMMRVVAACARMGSRGGAACLGVCALAIFAKGEKMSKVVSAAVRTQICVVVTPACLCVFLCLCRWTVCAQRRDAAAARREPGAPPAGVAKTTITASGDPAVEVRARLRVSGRLGMCGWVWLRGEYVVGDVRGARCACERRRAECVRTAFVCVVPACSCSSRTRRRARLATLGA